MTDFQAWEIVIETAVRRHRQANPPKSRKGPDRLPNREEYIQVGLKLGGEAGQLGRDYDNWLQAVGDPNGGNTR